MARKATFIKGIFTDASQNDSYLGDLSAADWVKGVLQTLHYLYDNSPCATSRAILDGIGDSGKTVTIIPSQKRAVGPDKDFANAAAEPTDYRAAAAPGKPTENSDPQLGTGGGSDVLLQFVAQDWESLDASPISFKAVDEVLLHELVHALRQSLGQEDNSNLPPPMSVMGLGGMTEFSDNDLVLGKLPAPSSITQVYQNLEEFTAILVTNVYRSENQRIGLVRDHLGPQPLQGDPAGPAQQPFRDPKEVTRGLGWPLTKPRNFMTLWRPQITRLSTELDVEHVASKVANVSCAFNPFFELMRK
jgi:hypothetical protein